MASTEEIVEYKIQSAVRGFHVYQKYWTPVIGEQLISKRETDNSMHKYAVAVMKGELTVGHLPREKAKIFSFFLKHSGNIKITISSDKRRYCKQACGLEIPCVLTFTASKGLIEGLKKLL